jgi:hypothetical protein
MLRYTVTGAVPKKKQFEQYIDRIMNDFFPQDISDHVNLDIKFKPCCEYDAAGYCYDDDGGITVEIAKTCGGVPYTVDQLAVHLAHELVHVKQYIEGTGGLNDRLPYELRPSEIEAYALEYVLCEKYWNK